MRWWRSSDIVVDALAAGCDAAVQMIDIWVVRVHKHGASIADTIIKIWVAHEGA